MTLDLYVLAGSRAESIKKNLSDSGCNVIDCVEFLSEDLLDEPLIVDKFVIVDHSFDPASNMSILRKLLLGDFFSAQEIVFIGNPNRQTIVFFNACLTHSKNNKGWDGNVRVYSDEISPLNSILSRILNSTVGEEVKKNVRANVYREFKDNKVLVAEDLDKADFNLKDGTSISRYETIRLQAMQSRNSLISDMMKQPKRNISIGENYSFDTVEAIKDSKLKYKNTVVVTGERKSGKTVLISTLISSLIKSKKRVLLIDAQENASTTEILREYYDIKTLYMKDCFSKFNLVEDYFKKGASFISVISLKGLERDIAIQSIKYLEGYFSEYSVVLVDLPAYNKNYFELFYRYNKVLITSSLRRIDIQSLKELVESLCLKKLVTFVYSDVYSNMTDMERYTPEEANSILEDIVAGKYEYTTEFKFNNLNTSASLALLLLGGVLESDTDIKKSKG